MGWLLKKVFCKIKNLIKMLKIKIRNRFKDYCKIQFNNLFFVSLFYFAVLTLLIILGKRVFWPDEGIYIALGKYIFSNKNSGLFEPFRPFLFPIVLGFFWKLGISPLIFGYVFEFATGLTCIILTWKITEKLFGKKYALIASLFIITNLEFIINSTRILTDVPALAFAAISIYFFINKKYFLSGFFSGISFMTKFTYGILPIMLLFVYLIEKIYYYNLTKNKTKNSKTKFSEIMNIMKFVTGLAIITAPYFIYSKISYKSFTWTLRIANTVVKSYAWFVDYSGFFSYLKKLFISMPLIALSLLGIFYFLRFLLSKKSVLKNLKDPEFELLSISVLCFLFYTIYFGIFARHDFRYSLHIIFFSAVLISFGIFGFEKNLKKNSLKVFNIAVAVFFLVSISGQLNYIRGIYNENYYSKSEGELIEFLRNNIRTDDFLLTTTTIPAIYFDNKMLGFASYDYALGVLEENRLKKGLIIVNSCDYGCDPKDYECQLNIIEFLKALEKEKLIFESKTNDEGTYRVYDNR
jgi:hypothetical protein